MSQGATIAAWLILATLGHQTAIAAEVPSPGKTDHRIRHVNYDAHQVYRVTGYFGYALTLMFDRGERIHDVVMGDPEAWDVVPRGHVLSIKPKAEDPHTSMLVLTDKREYVFDVRAKPPRRTPAGQAMDRDQAFLVRFGYPERDAARQAAAEAQQAAYESANRIEQARLEAERQVVANMPAKPINRNYQATGESELIPIEAWDDGTFTYLRFSAQQGVPAIYSLSIDGQEIIAPKHAEGDVVVIQRVSRKLVLRRGQAVACLFNEGPVLRTAQPTSGSSDRAGARLLVPMRGKAPAGRRGNQPRLLRSTR
ncbi:MAG: P-type conjugative transfer protein VirB9 [Paracoccaceae bacterium]